VHGTLEAYEQAKARLWAHQPTDGIAIANAGDPAVLRNLPGRPTDLTFGSGSSHASTEGGTLTVLGQSLGGVEELPRHLPHDVENYLAAALVAMTAGASASAARGVLGEFRGLPHRMELVARADGISWFNDSKATTPHAVVTGVSGHNSVVLIAGGRNKGVDLAPLRDLAPVLRSVVAIGEAGSEIAAAFDGVVDVVEASSMESAVCIASNAASPGDAVVLSPGCTSYDWYQDYSARGDDFVRKVLALTGARPEGRE
ncbi:MAG: glutamate ligase domain-containing protein, partial [Acidimicrobiales bacterium]